MKKRIVNTTPLVCYVWLLITGGCLLWYLLRVMLFLTAIASQQGIHSDPHTAIAALTQALRYDRNHPDYASGLAGALLQSAATLTSPAEAENRANRLHEAETWFQRAVMLDPANPWNYYELGRIGQFRGECRQQEPGQFEECSTARYFLAALKQAPQKLFLRRYVGRWFYYFDQEFTFEAIRPLLAQHQTSISEEPATNLELAEFLYDLHLDYQSDQYYAQAQQTPFSLCSDSQDHLWLQRSPEALELSYDDGSGEWRTYLASEQTRIHKLFCLPLNIEPYKSVAVKLLMNNGGSANFDAYLYLDEHLIYHYNQGVPRQAKWYEIPFDPALLHGKSQINLYIRVTGASRSGNFLQLWGDQDTPNHNSSFNFHNIEDLSPDHGIQRGEYLIRLVFKK